MGGGWQAGGMPVSTSAARGRFVDFDGQGDTASSYLQSWRSGEGAFEVVTLIFLSAGQMAFVRVAFDLMEIVSRTPAG